MTTLGFAGEIDYFKQQIFERGIKLPLNVCINTNEFGGDIPLHR
jgi:hypothetical protein